MIYDKYGIALYENISFFMKIKIHSNMEVQIDNSICGRFFPNSKVGQEWGFYEGSNISRKF